MSDHYAQRDLFKQSEELRAKARRTLALLLGPDEILPASFVSETVDAFVEAVVDAAVCQMRAILDDDS